MSFGAEENCFWTALRHQNINLCLVRYYGH